MSSIDALRNNRPWVEPMSKYSYVRHTKIPASLKTCTTPDDCLPLITNCCMELDVIDRQQGNPYYELKDEKEAELKLKQLGKDMGINFPTQKSDSIIKVCANVSTFEKLQEPNNEGLFYYSGAPILYRG